MSFRTGDWIQESSISEGTGSFALGGALTPGATFSSVCSNSDTFDYSIHHATLNEFEVGRGMYQTSGNLLLRSQVFSSSNANTAVNFSPGNKTVQLVISAERISSWGNLGPSIASSSAVIPLNSAGDVYTLSSFTTAITGFSFNNDRPGRLVIIRFLTSRLLTHSVPALQLLGNADIQTNAGDSCIIKNSSGGQAEMVFYQRFNGQPLSLPDVTPNVTSATTSAAGKVELADSTETNTGTDTIRAVTPAGLAAWTGKSTVTTVGTLTSGNATAIITAASESTAGKVELADVTETNTGTDATRAVSPASLAGWSPARFATLVASLGSTITVTTNTVTDVISFNRPANSDRVGTTYRIKAIFSYTKTAVSTTSPVFTIAFGGTAPTGFPFTLTQNATAATGQFITIDALVTIRTLGAANTAVHATNLIALGSSTLSAVTTPQGVQSQTTAAISTTVAQTIALRVNLAATVASNSISCSTATIERLG